jgi:hypothetical protein
MVAVFRPLSSARLPLRVHFARHVRLTEIRFEGLVGLIPPLSYSLP